MADDRGGRPRFAATMRVTVTLLAIALLTQAVTAGLLLSTPGGRMAHSATAAFVVLAGVVQLVAAILVWRPGGGSPRFALISVFLLVTVLVEGLAGAARLTALHVPLGALLLAGGAVLASRTWSRR